MVRIIGKCVFTPDRGVKEFLENKGRGKKLQTGG
jgi:hypothetical protein